MRGLMLSLLIIFLLLLLGALLFATPIKEKHSTTNEKRVLKPIRNMVKIDGVRITINRIELQKTAIDIYLTIQLPNPCYRVEDVTSYKQEDEVVIAVELKPPAKNTMCIQVLPPPQKYHIRITIENQRLVLLNASLGSKTVSEKIAVIKEQK